MNMFIKSLFIITFLGCAYCVNISAQCPAVMPAGTACLTQAEQNRAAANALTVIAQDKEIAVLQQGLKDKDASIERLQKVNAENTADLTKRINEVTVNYATVQGQLIGANAEIVRQSATIQFLLTNGRKKCSWSIICLP